MATWGLGLRAKSMLALLLACMLALLPAGMIGWQVLDNVRQHFGEAYARNFTQLKRERILAPVTRELALSRRLANSILTSAWLLDEDHPEKRARFFAEAEAYRHDLHDQAYFFTSALSQHYYFNDNEKPYSTTPRYTLDADKKSDSWFFATLEHTDDFNINVDYDAHLRQTRVWINVIVRDGARKIGVAGAGINLSSFIDQFISTRETGVTPMIVGRNGAIQAHRNTALIATNQAASQTEAVNPAQTLAGQLPAGPQRQALDLALAAAEAKPGEVFTLPADLDGQPQLLALSYIPELKWHIVTAVDLHAAQVLDRNLLHSALIALVLLLGVLLLAFAVAVEKLLLRPLQHLKASAQALAKGNYEVALPPPSQDELGDLNQAFGTMVTQIRNHTSHLEDQVQRRTQALEAANLDMQRAHQQINDSIDYASLIQRAILPDQSLRQWLGPHHFVLWHPRDVVGGDFYLLRDAGEERLIGVVDCAGHGVPGALMTMLARSAIEHAINQHGSNSPAAILSQTDDAMRNMLQECQLPRAIATNMDVGLVLINEQERRLRYAGAKISLYWSDGQTVGECKGHRRAIGDRRRGNYADSEILLQSGVTYYLTTDGFLDQAGGEMGYGFGNTRFAQLLCAHARLPMNEQATALEQALRDYQGALPQRDDVTILSFRFD